MSRRAFLVATLLVVPLLVIGKDEKKPAEFNVKDVAVRVSGPYAHENLTVFLLHSKEQDAREFLTLDQALDHKLVSVTEQDQEQVGQLVIDNKSDKHLFLQEGDRIQGGKQDRIIITSLVVPPKSGPMKLPTFCCEAGRWALGAQGKEFANTANAIYAPQPVRGAAKFTPNRGGQAAVWDEVARQKGDAMRRLGSSNTNTSLNETLDSAQVKKVCEACAKVMDELPAKHPDAIGMAFAVNGKVEEINIYPNARLFARVFPRLAQSYAVQAALEKDKLKGKPAPAVASADVEKFMKGGKEKSNRFEDVNGENRVRFRDLDGELEAVTAYKGAIIHRQLINRAAVPEATGRGDGNRNQPQQRENDTPPRQERGQERGQGQPRP